MDFEQLKQQRIGSFTGSDIVSEWQRHAYEMGIEDFKNRGLPDIEKVSSKVHEAWIESKRSQGVLSRLSEGGEELMVPCKSLSEKSKDLDRNTVKAVYKAIKELING